MNFYWHIISLIIGYYYAQKTGREAVVKFNQFPADKKRKNNHK
jgi:hypothetical protein